MEGARRFYSVDKAIEFGKSVKGRINNVGDQYEIRWTVKPSDKLNKIADFISERFNDNIQMFYTRNTVDVDDEMTRIYDEDGIAIYYCVTINYIEIVGLTEVEFTNLCVIVDHRLKERKEKEENIVKVNNNDNTKENSVKDTGVIKYPDLFPYKRKIEKAISPIINEAYDEGFRDGCIETEKIYKEDNNRKELKIFADGFSEGLTAMWEMCKTLVMNMTMDQMIEAFGKDFTMESVFDLEPKVIIEKLAKYHDDEDDNGEDLFEF